MKFHHVVCGGTFDHLHKGHKKLLNECSLRGEKVTVGITNKALLRHKAYGFSLESYSIRVKNISQFNSSFLLYKLHDLYGPTLTDISIDAICVTKDTLLGAKMINKRRKKLGMKPLSIIIVPFVYDDNNEKISSERIRQGIIDRTGRNYYKYLIGKEKHILPESLKRLLRKPLGRVISSLDSLSEAQLSKMKVTINNRSYFYPISIGDVITYNLKKRGVMPSISVIDGISQRKALNKETMEFILEKERSSAVNEKGTIQKNACIEIQKLFDVGQKRATKQLFIQGEEDLLTLVVVLLSPLNSHVWYGQNEKGAIDVRVTEKKKQTVYNLLRQFG